LVEACSLGECYQWPVNLVPLGNAALVLGPPVTLPES
jgi:hypothetical protein